MNNILAKSDGTTLEKHTNDLFICYENWLREIHKINPLFYNIIYQWDSIMRDVIFFHDQGKRLSFFQKYLNDKKTDYVYHEIISIAFISRNKKKSWDECAEYAINAIALHHHRNSDKLLHMWDIWDEQINELKQDFIDNPSNWEDMLSSGRWDGFISTVKRNDIYQSLDYNDDDFDLKKHIFFKGMLHKCDYAASAGIKELEIPYKGSFEEGFCRIIQKKDISLSPLQMAAANLSDKSVILIAPTGSGKTEFAMNWVQKDKSCKVFYLLGMRTAVQKMYERWSEGFGDNVSLLHGEIAYEYMNEPESDTYDNVSDRLTLIRQLSYPITITTADQLVTSTLKYHSFETVYITCAYSQIIVDEIQSFDPEAMAIIVFFLKEIHKLGGRFMLMTATLPPFVREKLLKLDNVALVDPLGDSAHSKPYNMDKFRHKFQWLKDSYINSPDAVSSYIDSYNDGKSVLIICNTVLIAQDVMTKLKDSGADVNLLHARFTRKHRAEKEEKISKDAPSKGMKPKPVIWISTQIVEASLDIDFDELHTEICAIDSLLQRFGRCWRNREIDYSSNEPNIFIYNFDSQGNPKNYTESIYNKELLESTKEQISYYDKKLLTEKDKYDLFNNVFNGLKKGNGYIKKYEEMLKRLQNGHKADNRREAQEIFRKSGMLNYNIIPLDFQQEVDKLLEEWETSSDKLKLQKEIMQYAVSAPVKSRDVSKKLHPLENRTHSKFISGIYYALSGAYKYDCELGLVSIGADDLLLMD